MTASRRYVAPSGDQGPGPAAAQAQSRALQSSALRSLLSALHGALAPSRCHRRRHPPQGISSAARVAATAVGRAAEVAMDLAEDLTSFKALQHYKLAGHVATAGPCATWRIFMAVSKKPGERLLRVPAESWGPRRVPWHTLLAVSK